MFASLGHRNYRIYFVGALVSNIGTWLMRVAQDWLVLELSAGSAVAVGITTALQFLPALLLAPPAGLLDSSKLQLAQRTTRMRGAIACALGVRAGAF